MLSEMRIETERLIIRAYKKADMMGCFELMQDKELFRYLNMKVMSLEEYKELFDWLIDSYKVGFHQDFKYSFNIILKETGAHIGWCGIGGSEFDHSNKEIYYLIGREHWGKGYAKEAAGAMLDYGFNTIGLDRISALVDPDNVASERVIENIGLRFNHVIDGLPEEFEHYNKHFYYSLTKSEHSAMKKHGDIVIETDRLIVRPFLPSDARAAFNYSNQPKVAYWMSDMVLKDEAHALSWIGWINKSNSIEDKFIVLAIVCKEENLCIGVVGVHPKEEINNEVELLYGLSDPYQGKGYTTEAVAALVSWIFDNTKLKFLSAIVKPENIPSIRVIEKLGFLFVDSRNLNYDGSMCDFNYYRLLK